MEEPFRTRPHLLGKSICCLSRLLFSHAEGSQLGLEDMVSTAAGYTNSPL